VDKQPQQAVAGEDRHWQRQAKAQAIKSLGEPLTQRVLML
jgi:hypothetical protein